MSFLPNSTRGSFGVWAAWIVCVMMLFVLISSAVHAQVDPNGNVVVRLFDTNLGDDRCRATIQDTGFSFETQTTKNDSDAFRTLALQPDTYHVVVRVLSGGIFTTCTFEVVEGGSGAVIAFTAPFGLGQNPNQGPFVVTAPIKGCKQIEQDREDKTGCPFCCPPGESDPVPKNRMLNQPECQKLRECCSEEGEHKISADGCSVPPFVEKALEAMFTPPVTGGFSKDFPFGFKFKPICDRHDRDFRKCYTDEEAPRKNRRANERFWRDLYEQCNEQPIFASWICKQTADLYSVAINQFNNPNAVETFHNVILKFARDNFEGSLSQRVVKACRSLYFGSFAEQTCVDMAAADDPSFGALNEKEKQAARGMLHIFAKKVEGGITAGTAFANNQACCRRQTLECQDEPPLTVPFF